MKEKNFISEIENLPEFQLGQLDILHWLERTFQKQLAFIENKNVGEILNQNAEDIVWTKALWKTTKHYLQEVKKIIEDIKESK